MKVTLFTDKFVKAIKPPRREDKQALYVKKLGHGRSGRSLVLHVSYGGAKTWRIAYYKGGTRKRRVPDGSEKVVATRLSASAKLGSYPDMSLREAYEAARVFEPPKAAAAARRDARFEVVAERWLSEHVEARGLISARGLRRHVGKYMAPAFAGRRLHDIDQDDITDLLDHIAEHHGKVTADHVLASLRNLLGWWRAKDKSYAAVPSPIVKGMHRGAAAERDRVLDDDELRLFWRLTGDGSVFGGLCRMLLLTGQRLTTVHTMRWTDINAEGVWVVPGKQGSGKRKAGDPKRTIGAVKLPPLALATLGSLPKVGSPFVFPGVTARLVDHSYNKRRLCNAMADTMLTEHRRVMERWTLHDLRRTLRTRLSQLKVDYLVGEFVLGHTIKGVGKVYDRYERLEEKSEALARFATHMLAVTGENVVRLPVSNRAAAQGSGPAEAASG